MYLHALQHAYAKAEAASEEAEPALAGFKKLCQRIAAAHGGVVSDAGRVLATIIQGGVRFVLEVNPLSGLIPRPPSASQCRPHFHISLPCRRLKQGQTLSMD